MPRRKQRKRRRIFIHTPIKPPEVYLLTPTVAAAAMGISIHTLKRFRKSWQKSGMSCGHGPEPIRITFRSWRYRVDECWPVSEGEPGFLERMRIRLADDIAKESRTVPISTGTPSPTISRTPITDASKIRRAERQEIPLDKVPSYA
jgi:hypothetical protein